MYFHVSTLTPYVPGFTGTRFYTLIPTSATARFARSRRGYACFSAMTRPGVLSLSPHMTFCHHPQEDKEIPPARAAQALLTLPPPLPGVLIPTNL
nr:MAG TPA: hypothetical protein [Caudoviricetes sp.]